MRVEELGGADVRQRAEVLVSIWARSKPGADNAARQQLIQRHSHCPGFRCFTANYEDVIAGFTYGLYSGQGTGGPPIRGQTRSIGSDDLIADKIGSGSLSSGWLDAFDIAELQVLTEYRRQGIGESLIRELCEGLPPGPVVLTVEDEAEPAKRLYQKLGFTELSRTVPSLMPPTLLIVMGRNLPLSES